MKRLSLILIFLLLAPVLAPCFPARAEPSLIPHEDPSAAQSTIDSISLLTEYADIFALALSRQYGNASQLSEQLSHITVPADLSYIVGRYNDLTSQLLNVLNELDSTLNLAETLIDQYRLDEAGQVLDRAGVLVSKAEILLTDLQEATSTISQRLGVFSASAESKIREAYNSLFSMLQRLRELIDLYHQLLERANARLQTVKSQQLDATSLSLYLNATQCFVGGYLHASGVLTSNGETLANREVEVLLDGQKVSTTKTDATGSYYSIIRLPYKYVDYVSVSALYTPKGSDQGVYLASVSPTIRVQVLFYRTMLNISVSSYAYPGLALTIIGNVSAQDGAPLSGRHVQVQLDGSVVAQVTTGAAGGFMVNPTIPAQTKLGKHLIAVIISPAGLFAGTSIQKTVTVARLHTDLQITVPSFVVLPSQLQVNGTVTAASRPLKGTNILVEFANMSATAKTSSDGSFNVTIDIPLDRVFAGNQELSVTAQPAESWQEPTRRTASILALNSVGIGAAFASSFSVAFIMYFNFAKKRNRKGQKTVEVSTTFALPAKEAAAVSVELPAVIAEKKYDGLKGIVIKAYVEALKTVQTATGETLTANKTLREYLEAAITKLGEAAAPFSELTSLAEKALYSTHTPSEADSENAEKLASTIRRIAVGST